MSSDDTKKRTAEESGLPELQPPQTKRVKCPFLYHNDGDDQSDYLISAPSSADASHTPTIPAFPNGPIPTEAPGLPAASSFTINSEPPEPVSLVTKTSNNDKSPSLDCGPHNSPPRSPEYVQPSQLDTLITNKLGCLNVPPNYVAGEEEIIDLIFKYNNANGGSLSSSLFAVLQNEVHLSSYGRIPCSLENRDTTVKAAAFSAAVRTYTEASTQAEDHGPTTPTLTFTPIVVNVEIVASNDDTIAFAKSPCSNAGTQTAPIPPAEPEWDSIYAKYLELIRMKKPFLSGKGVITVKTRLRPVPKAKGVNSAHRVVRHPFASAPGSRRTRTSENVSAASTPDSSAAIALSPQVISLDDSDDDNDDGDASTQPAAQSWSRTGGASDSTPGSSVNNSAAVFVQPVTPASSQSEASIYGHVHSGNASDSLAAGTVRPNKPEDGHILDYTGNMTSGASSCVGGGTSDKWNKEAAYMDDKYNRCYSEFGTAFGDETEATIQSLGWQQYITQGSREGAEFYGFTGNEFDLESQLRFQNRDLNLGQVPGPAAGTRLHMQHFLAAVGANHSKDPEAQINKILEEETWGFRETLTDDEAIAKIWCADPSDIEIMKGFPLIEDVEFLVHGNHATPNGDCYWRSISFILYGSDRHWDIVKAEHLAYVAHVLKSPRHARHGLYTEHLNKKWFMTASAATDGQGLGPFRANMWQVLQMPHAWTPAFMQQVTADLYNICVITFTHQGRIRGDGVIVETAVRGSYNARHIFLQFVNGNHFQPMVPNQHRPSEFQYPRVTVDKTAKYTSAPKTTSKKTSLEHPWRNDFTSSVPAPVPRLNGCDVNKLSMWLGSS